MNILKYLLSLLVFFPVMVLGFSCDKVTEIPKVECEALVALYDSTDGDNWIYNNDWKQTNTPCSWYTVSCNNRNIISLDLSFNNLKGKIPSELGNLTNLININLHDNQLSGNIPSELGNLTNLQSLPLGNNQLSGEIPSELGNLTNLININLHDNQLSGNIPSELGNLTNLQSLPLGNNQLSGKIPSELGNLTNLTYINLYNNQLSGSIPFELGNLNNLQTLSLGNNQLSGKIPYELGNLSNLTYVNLYNNQLSGSIPFELGNLNNLQTFSLGNNQLSGKIPSELGNLSSLINVNLSLNNLCGSVSQSFTNLNNIINSDWGDQKPCSNSNSTTCQLYGVHDAGLNNTQFFTVSPKTFEVKALGEMKKAHDIEALDAHPQTGKLFAASGNDTNKPAHLYRVDKNNGQLTDIGFTGMKEIDGLSFHPDGTLWGWSTGDGLVTIDTTNGQANVKVAHFGEIEDITWNATGTILYGVENVKNNPDKGMKLLAYEGNTVTTICKELTSSLEIEALDTLPDDTLIFGLHGRNSLPLGVIDVANCQIVAKTKIATGYDDVEGIAWPNCQ